jgi:hypothetical protein
MKCNGVICWKTDRDEKPVKLGNKGINMKYNNNNNNHGSTALYGLGPPRASSFRGY